MGRIDLALLSFNRVVELDPEMVIAHVRLSELYELQGNLEEAVRESEEAYLYLTDASSTKERMILARLQQLESRLNFRDGRHQGLLYLRKGSFREAEEAFREVLLIQPDQAEIHYLLGTVLGIQNRLEEAIERFQWSLRIKPDLIDSRMRLAELYQVKGEWVKARSELEKAAFFLEDRDGGEAQLIEARLDAVEDQVEIKELTDRSFQEIESGRTDAAVLTLQSLLKLNPEEPSVHFNLGNLWAQKSRLDLAEGAFKKAIELRPNDPQAHQRLGQVYELVRYYGRAKEEYEKARIGLSPDDPLQKELANAIARTEQETEAARASAETLGSQSEERFNAGDLDGAISGLEQAVAIYPENAGLQFRLGEVYAESGRIDPAIGRMMRAIDVDPKDFRLFEWLAKLYEGKGYLYQALRGWKKAEALHPSDRTRDEIERLLQKMAEIEHKTTPLVERGKEEARKGNGAVAVELLGQAISLAQDDARLRIELALLYMGMGPSRSIDAYTELNAVSLHEPERGEAPFHLGVLYASAGQWEDAARSFEGAIKAEESSEALRSKARSELEQVRFKIRDGKEARRYLHRGNRRMAEQDYRGAIESFERVIRLHPSDSNSLYFIGYCYENLGDEKNARRYYESVLKISPRHLQANQRLAFVYEKEGRVERAIDLYRWTMDGSPGREFFEMRWIRDRLAPLEKRYILRFNQVILGYDSNPSGALNRGGDLSSAIGLSFNYYLKKDRSLQIPIGLSTQNQIRYQSSTLFSNQTLSIAAISGLGSYTYSVEYNAYLGIARGGLTGRGQIGLFSLYRKGTFPSTIGLEYSYDDFFSYGSESNDAVRQRIRLTGIQNWNAQTLQASYTLFNNDANLADQAYRSHGIGVTYRRFFLDNLIQGSVSYNLELKEYKNPDSFNTFKEQETRFRRNFLHQIGWSAAYFFQDNLSLGVNYTQLFNRSNLPANFAPTLEQRLSGQAESLGGFKQRMIQLYLNWVF